MSLRLKALEQDLITTRVFHAIGHALRMQPVRRGAHSVPFMCFLVHGKHEQVSIRACVPLAGSHVRRIIRERRRDGVIGSVEFHIRILQELESHQFALVRDGCGDECGAVVVRAAHRRHRHVRPRFGRVVEHDHITVLRAPGGRFEFLHRQWRPRMADVLGPDGVRTLGVPRAIRAVAAARGNDGHERRRGECGRLRESCRHVYPQSSVPPCLSPRTSIMMAHFSHLRMYAIRTIPTRRMPQRQYCPPLPLHHGRSRSTHSMVDTEI